MGLRNACSYLAVLLLCIAVSAYKIKGNGSYVFYDREAWKSQEATDARPLKTPVPYVVIHHTYIPPECHSFEECAKDMRSMQTYHKSLGWGDIGYNFCVGTEGSAYEGRGWHTVGIHARQANNYSIGICLIGDWRVKLPPPLTLQTTKELIADGVDKGVISQNYKLIGHMQTNPTECPGKALMDEISTWPHYTPGPFPDHIDIEDVE